MSSVVELRPVRHYWALWPDGTTSESAGVGRYVVAFRVVAGDSVVVGFASSARSARWRMSAAVRAAAPMPVDAAEMRAARRGRAPR